MSSVEKFGQSPQSPILSRELAVDQSQLVSLRMDTARAFKLHALDREVEHTVVLRDISISDDRIPKQTLAKVGQNHRRMDVALRFFPNDPESETSFDISLKGGPFGDILKIVPDKSGGFQTTPGSIVGNLLPELDKTPPAFMTEDEVTGLLLGAFDPTDLLFLMNKFAKHGQEGTKNTQLHLIKDSLFQRSRRRELRAKLAFEVETDDSAVTTRGQLQRTNVNGKDISLSLKTSRTETVGSSLGRVDIDLAKAVAAAAEKIGTERFIQEGLYVFDARKATLDNPRVNYEIHAKISHGSTELEDPRSESAMNKWLQYVHQQRIWEAQEGSTFTDFMRLSLRHLL